MNDDAILAQMPIDRAVCFTDENGKPSDRVRARQSKWLLKLWPLLRGKLASDERILYLARAEYEQESSFIGSWYLLMFTTAQMLRLPRILIAGDVLAAITSALEKLDPDRVRVVDVVTVPYRDITCFEVWSAADWSLALRMANGGYEQYLVKEEKDKYKIRTFLRQYVNECQSV